MIDQLKMWFELLKPIVLWSFGIFLVIVLAVGAYSSADESGYLSHSVEAYISAQPSWLIGETKDCSSIALDSITARMVGNEVGYVAAAINCDDGPQHRIEITVYGSLVQPERTMVNWHCTRESDSFTCRQSGAKE